MRIHHKLAAMAMALTMLAGAAIAAPAAQPATAKSSGATSPGVTATTIRLGRIGALTGVNARQGNSAVAGIKAEFAEINAAGGVCGRQLDLSESLDDGYSAERTKKAAQEVIEKNDVLALMDAQGTPETDALIQMLEVAKIPLIASTSGSANNKIERNGKSAPARYFFKIRNDNKDDADGINKQLDAIGDRSVALIVQDDGFGRAAAEAFRSSAKEYHIDIAGEVEVPATVDNAEPYVRKLMSGGGSAAHSIVMLMIDKPTAASIDAIHALGYKLRLFAVTSSGEFERVAGVSGAVGVIVSQSFPPLASYGDGVGSPGNPAAVPAFRELMAARAPDYKTSVIAFEGYLSARILADALRTSCGNLTREGLVQALEKFKNHDIGGIYYSYDTPNHEGTHMNDTFMWTKDGHQLF